MAASDSVLIDTIRAVGRLPGPRARSSATASVGLASGAKLKLNARDPRSRVWREVLLSRLESRQPVYVTVNPRTKVITSLLLPDIYRATEITELKSSGDIEIQFDRSHAIHSLLRRHPDFGLLRALLDDSLRTGTRVLVVEDLDGSQIIDVRPVQVEK